MTVQTTTSRADYTGNGVTTTFTVPFYFLDNTHLQVIRTQLTTGIASTLALTTDYTVSGAGVGTGGSITCMVAPTSDQRISILRNVPLTQLTNYVENDPFPAESHEQALDKLTMEVQQVNEIAARSLTLPANTSGVSTTLPYPAANQLIAWNQNGNALQNISTSNLLTVAGSSGFSSQLFSGTGAQVDFVLPASPGFVDNLEVFVSGVRQTPGPDYDVSGATITFTTAPPVGTANILARWGQTFGVGVLASGSVSPDKLSAGAPTWSASGGQLQLVQGTFSTTKYTAWNTSASGRAEFIMQAGVNSCEIKCYGPSAATPNEFRFLQSAPTGPITFYQSNAKRLEITSAGNVVATSGALGYGTGAGSFVTQSTSRTTGVTINKPTGSITLVSAAGSATYQTFTVTNSFVAATDTIVVNQRSGTDRYIILVTAVAAGSFNITFATTGGTTTEQPVFNFAIIKGVTS